MSPNALLIVSRLRLLNGEARTLPLRSALKMAVDAFEAAVRELVALGRVVRIRGVGARIILA